LEDREKEKENFLVKGKKGKRKFSNAIGDTEVEINKIE
jgi:hypothetical protein